MSLVHPRFQSPWFATILQGIIAAILCLTVSLTTLINLTATALVFSYALIAISALAARWTGATSHGPYRMPLWPLPPVLAIAALIYVGTKQDKNLLLVAVAELAIGLLWWALVVLPQRGKAWTLKQPVLDFNEPAVEHVKQPV
jgi:amino acid transporter